MKALIASVFLVTVLFGGSAQAADARSFCTATAPGSVDITRGNMTESYCVGFCHVSLKNAVNTVGSYCGFDGRVIETTAPVIPQYTYTYPNAYSRAQRRGYVVCRPSAVPGQLICPESR